MDALKGFGFFRNRTALAEKLSQKCQRATSVHLYSTKNERSRTFVQLPLCNNHKQVTVISDYRADWFWYVWESKQSTVRNINEFEKSHFFLTSINDCKILIYDKYVFFVFIVNNTIWKGYKQYHINIWLNLL